VSAPFSVYVPGDPEGRVSLVLAVSHPYLLVGPAEGETSVRWVVAEECRLGRVYFDRPWHADFSAGMPAPHDHGENGS